MTAYPPIKVLQPGQIVWLPFGGVVLTGWVLDMQGRPATGDWARRYAPDILAAVAAFTGDELAAFQRPTRPQQELLALRTTQALLRRLRRAHRPGLFKRFARRLFP